MAPESTVATRHAIVHVTRSSVRPKHVTVYHTHPRGEGRADRRHAIEWHCEVLRPGEHLRIELMRIPKLDGNARHDEILGSIFHDEHEGGQRRTWTIPFGHDRVTSGHADLPDAELGHFDLHYDVWLVPAQGKARRLDPVIHIVPDP